MRAIVHRKGASPDGLTCEEIDRPTAGEGEVLIKVSAASVNALDWHLLKGIGPFRPNVPRPGRDVAGRVEAVGPNVTQFKPGDEVFGTCRGAFAEYVCAPESALAIKPPGVTFEQAASVPIAGITALQGLRDKGQVRPGHQVLVNGATGGVGAFAAQIARAFGAEVTGVCSTRNLEMVRSLGARHVIDYTREDFTRSGRRYDIILDVAGNHSFLACRRALTDRGAHILVGMAGVSLPTIAARAIAALAVSRLVSQRFGVFIANLDKNDLVVLAELLAAGKVAPVIETRYELTEAPEAIRRFGRGHVRGKLIIAVE